MSQLYSWLVLVRVLSNTVACCSKLLLPGSTGSKKTQIGPLWMRWRDVSFNHFQSFSLQMFSVISYIRKRWISEITPADFGMLHLARRVTTAQLLAEALAFLSLSHFLSSWEAFFLNLGSIFNEMVLGIQCVFKPHHPHWYIVILKDIIKNTPFTSAYREIFQDSVCAALTKQWSHSWTFLPPIQPITARWVQLPLRTSHHIL